MAKKDASIMLKDEIGESALRLKAAKFGHAIFEIVPEYDNTFYLPEKDKFKVPKSMNQRNRLAASTQGQKLTHLSASVNLPKLQPQTATGLSATHRSMFVNVKNSDVLQDSVFMTEGIHQTESTTRLGTIDTDLLQNSQPFSQKLS